MDGTGHVLQAAWPSCPKEQAGIGAEIEPKEGELLLGGSVPCDCVAIYFPCHSTPTTDLKHQIMSLHMSWQFGGLQCIEYPWLMGV